jgi:FAD/FMN-containing dehydrogenase
VSYPHFVVAALKSLVNAVVYIVSGRRTLYLEGRLTRGWYTNWSHDRRHRATWAEPETEDEVAEIIRHATSVRVVGAGHSFNDALATTGITISLDRLSGIVSIDKVSKQATVWGGTRLRDLTRLLLAEGLALRALASHDAQSIAGVLATDVHGTGREPAHTSDLVTSLRLVDGTGEFHDIGPEDELFRAAVGGIGAVGVITQLTLQCVDAFDIRKSTVVETRTWAREHLDRLLRTHDHASFYLYPFTDLLHVHTWDRTSAPRSPLGWQREAVDEAVSAVSAAVAGDFLAHTGRLPEHASTGLRLQSANNLVLRSHEAFSRSQYHLHQELEIAVPADRVWECADELLTMYEAMYEHRPLPFLLLELRFTPDGHDCSFLGGGTGRATAWLNLCVNQSGAVGDFYDAVEDWVRRTPEARCHLGKWCETIDAGDLARMHGARFDRFRKVRAAADPAGRFANPFTERLLGAISART